MNTTAQTMTPAEYAAMRAFIEAHLDILIEGMNRWNCSAPEALARLQALQTATR